MRMKHVDALLDEANRLVRSELEKRVRAVLRRNRRAKSFCMAMGSACFYDKAGSPLFDDEVPYAKPVWNLLSEYDGELKLSGEPMKINNCDGPLIKDW